MQNNDKKKICLVVSSLGKGGAERSAAILSKMLYHNGFDVHIVSVIDDIQYEYEGELFNLGSYKKTKDTFLGRFNRLRLFKKYIQKNKFDYILDSRTRISDLRELLIFKWVYRSERIIYFVSSFRLEPYFGKYKFIANLIYKNAFKLVAVSKAIQDRVQKTYDLDNVVTISNPIEKVTIDSGSKERKYPFEYILSYGRLDDHVKNLSLLIESYKESNLSENNIKLVIMGDGPDLENLKIRRDDLELHDDVIFIPFSKDPFSYVAEAKFTVLSSRYEGFPRTLIEALALGTPVISVDCKSGPNEIINHRENGLLVENFNSKALANAMDSFIFDKELYATCKNNAKSSVAHLSVENITKQWVKLLK